MACSMLLLAWLWCFLPFSAQPLGALGFSIFETANSASQLQRLTFKLPVSFKIFVRYPVINLVNSKTSTRKRLHHSPINNSSESFTNKISNGFLNAIKGMASQWGTALDRNCQCSIAMEQSENEEEKLRRRLSVKLLEAFPRDSLQTSVNLSKYFKILKQNARWKW